MTVEYNIENEEVILIQGKGNYCSKFKKGKLKTKKLSKITLLAEQKHSVQSADRNKAVQVWHWGNIVFTKTWKMSITSSCLKINSGLHAKKNPKQQYLKVVTSRSVMLHSANELLCFQPCSLDNTLYKPSSAWENFNIRQCLYCLLGKK